MNCPTLGRLMDGAPIAQLISSTPAITVPAWSSMTSSKDPGVLGFYGFRNRSDYTYDNRYIATGQIGQRKTRLGHFGRSGQTVHRRRRAANVSGAAHQRPSHLQLSYALTTNPARQWTHPASLRDEIDALLAPEIYDVDVPQFRTDDKEFLLKQIYDMTRKRFKMLRYLHG